MAEPASLDPYAFILFEGGLGKRFSVTSASSSVAIPGTQATENNRVLITNGGEVSAFIRMGKADVEATTDCQEILPGTTQTFTAPYIIPSGLYLAAVTASADLTTTIQVTAGKGF